MDIYIYIYIYTYIYLLICYNIIIKISNMHQDNNDHLAVSKKTPPSLVIVRRENMYHNKINYIYIYIYIYI